MDNISKKDNVVIENIIYEIRGKQVMLDSDLARLYECKNGTKEINQAVKNNVEKFPERYAFRISEEESKNLKSKNLTSSMSGYGGSRKGHTVFTEQGVAMLATILHTPVATQISIKIMDDSCVYHCGSSVNRIGYKTFSINLIEDEEVVIPLINRIKNIIH